MERLRDGYVNQGVNFLQKTTGAMSQRINFLENKGLSHKEIVEALKKTDQPSNVSSVSVGNLGVPSIWSFISSSAVIIGVGYIVYSWCSNVENSELSLVIDQFFYIKFRLNQFYFLSAAASTGKHCRNHFQFKGLS